MALRNYYNNIMINNNYSKLFTEVEVASGGGFTSTEVNNCFSIY